MIIVKLMGGLGNQLFQYAAARTLALKHGTDLKLDLSFINANAGNQHTKRELELAPFRANYQICNASERERFVNMSVWDKLTRHRLVAKEAGFSFDPHFFSLPSNTYLDGFWQSEKYFTSIRDTLLEELSLRASLPEAYRGIKQQILQSNSVSLHVRRGDYVSNKTARDFHGLLPMSYYQTALEHLRQETGDLKVFVFSDDLDWVKAHLNIALGPVYVDCQLPNNASFELFLMSLCRHNIIANSSFSWWGAWLNRRMDKRVVAPKCWFANEALNTDDLIPESWTRF